MAELRMALQQLRQERDHAQREVEKLEEAIVVIEGLNSRKHAERNGRRGRGGRAVRSRPEDVCCRSPENSRRAAGALGEGEGTTEETEEGRLICWEQTSELMSDAS